MFFCGCRRCRPVSAGQKPGARAVRHLPCDATPRPSAMQPYGHLLDYLPLRPSVASKKLVSERNQNSYRFLFLFQNCSKFAVQQNASAFLLVRFQVSSKLPKILSAIPVRAAFFVIYFSFLWLLPEQPCNISVKTFSLLFRDGRNLFEANPLQKSV